MNTLEKIVKQKYAEVAERKALYPTKLLERSIYFDSPSISLRKYSPIPALANKDIPFFLT